VFALSEDGISREIPRAARRLIALLALNRRGLSRTRAAMLLTPHLEPESAAGSLRATLARLRTSGPPVLETQADTLRLAPGVTVDAWELEGLAACMALSADASPERVSLDDFALELLPGWDDDWVLFERARLQDLFLHALEAHARQLASAGSVLPALAAAYEALRVDPLRESTARLLIEMYLAEGNQARAARAYLDFRQRLRSALGIEPSEAMRSLVGDALKATSTP
jgi:DNA-binding SARP family transcriptional activator